MRARWPEVPLGDVLQQDTRYITAPEPRACKKPSVKLYGKGVVLDAAVDGASLRMQRHQIARAGQVILSEICGKKGAIGFVPDDGACALCTSHSFLFDLNEERLTRGWLRAILAANPLESQLDDDATGTAGFAAVRPKTHLACTIPLPPLPEQQRIVARVDGILAEIERIRDRRGVPAISQLSVNLHLSLAGGRTRCLGDLLVREERKVPARAKESYSQIGVDTADD